MVYQPKRRDRIIAAAFPLLKINENDIQYVSEFRYLGHIINNRLTNDDDINREIRITSTRTNVWLRRFSKCSVSVKITLFKSQVDGRPPVLTAISQSKGNGQTSIPHRIQTP